MLPDGIYKEVYTHPVKDGRRTSAWEVRERVVCLETKQGIQYRIADLASTSLVSFLSEDHGGPGKALKLAEGYLRLRVQKQPRTIAHPKDDF